MSKPKEDVRARALRNFSVMTEVMMVECKEIQKMKESIKKEETKEKYTYMSIEFFMAYIDFFLKGNAKSKYLEYSGLKSSNGIIRIKELCQMSKDLHKNGIDKLMRKIATYDSEVIFDCLKNSHLVVEDATKDATTRGRYIIKLLHSENPFSDPEFKLNLEDLIEDIEDLKELEALEELDEEEEEISIEATDDDEDGALCDHKDLMSKEVKNMTEIKITKIGGKAPTKATTKKQEELERREAEAKMEAAEKARHEELKTLLHSFGSPVGATKGAMKALGELCSLDEKRDTLKEVLTSSIRSVVALEAKKKTIVIFNDGGKEEVICGPEDAYDATIGVALAVFKHAFRRGSYSSFISELAAKTTKKKTEQLNLFDAANEAPAPATKASKPKAKTAAKKKTAR